MKYGFIEIYCVIPHKASYMDDETWEKVAKVVSRAIRKTKVNNGACVFLFITYKYKSLSLSLQII